MSVPRAVPVLPSRDLRKTSAFYARLGFIERGLWPEEYLIVERGPLELHFFHAPETDPATSAFSCYLRVEDPAALFELWVQAAPDVPQSCFGAPRLQRPLDEEGEYALIDEDGTALRLGRVRGD